MANNKWDSDWIYFSKRARRGIFVLLILYVAVAVSPRLYHNYIYKPPDYNIEYSRLEQANSDSLAESVSRYQQPQKTFDPNLYTIDEWMAVGLSEKQASSILKYLSSGAKLSVKSDLKKLYVVDEELYSLLEPKVNLPDSIFSKKEEETSRSYEKSNASHSDLNKGVHKPDTDPTVQVSPVSINRSSSRDLQTIPGVGPYFAQEIIKIRESYGGIIFADQLLDIYKMDEDKLEEILPYLIINKDEVNKLNVNTATEEQLRQHPLITRDMAKSIVYFRENHKKYESLNGLLLSPYIDLQVLKKIEPYLKVD
ncbi:MAG TPA: helix-hairpin-helix domain-containing protein [Brumimicrobium sp.]|nr:helix-hairpin-helix domain-containing protein [Brumimicrobium sp.]